MCVIKFDHNLKTPKDDSVTLPTIALHVTLGKVGIICGCLYCPRRFAVEMQSLLYKPLSNTSWLVTKEDRSPALTPLPLTSPCPICLAEEQAAFLKEPAQPGQGHMHRARADGSTCAQPQPLWRDICREGA